MDAFPVPWSTTPESVADLPWIVALAGPESSTILHNGPNFPPEKNAAKLCASFAADRDSGLTG